MVRTKQTPRNPNLERPSAAMGSDVQARRVPLKPTSSICNALIDTGATKSCISERYYQELPSIKMQKFKRYQ